MVGGMDYIITTSDNNLTEWCWQYIASQKHETNIASPILSASHNVNKKIFLKKPLLDAKKMIQYRIVQQW